VVVDVRVRDCDVVCCVAELWWGLLVDCFSWGKGRSGKWAALHPGGRRGLSLMRHRRDQSTHWLTSLDQANTLSVRENQEASCGR
jgi:hypothetical protein